MDRFALTPYFLDEPQPGLASLSTAEWQLNQAELLQEGDQRRSMSALHEALAQWVAETLRAGHRPISVAGDCCASIGVAAGLQRAGIAPTLIWLDAHGDFNTWETTPSGFLGGMPLAMLVGRGEQTLLEAVRLSALPEEHVVLSDARDLDPGEAEAVAESRIMHLENVNDLLTAPLPDRPIWIHFDTDVVDPVDAPAMSYPAPGGPAAGQVQAVFRHLAKSGRIYSVSMSTWNPELAGAEQTARICMRLLQTLLTG